ncbi:hypothetical protein VTL71DRAFT_6932 [Oculimacula yallundae]|uniref:Peptidase M1 membrane alanine aminopeptidase domain-containing protein n=1 Tax=Oculimacula yallundae TaxID=86028 RepID=A0ABR4BV88_9HELO
MATLTALARIYSHPAGKRGNLDHKILKTKTSLKSGLTPSFPGKGAADKNKEHKRLEDYQRIRFFGFTAAELQASESLAPYHAPTDRKLLNDPTSIKSLGPINPVLAKSQWQEQIPKHQALFPLGNGRSGFWHVNTPIVWEALEPAIRLATMFIIGGTAWSWWDTILAGEYTQIPVSEYPKEYDHEAKGMRYRISPRASIEVYRDRRNLDQVFIDLAKEVIFHLSSGEIHPSTGTKRGYHATGETLFQDSDKTIVYFSFESLEPLLNNQITAAERMACHFRNATILLHELAHALWGTHLWKSRKVPAGRPGEPIPKEPYIGTEYFAELRGFSMEMHIFGGMTAGHEFNTPTSAKTKGLPTAGFFQTSITTYDVKNCIVLAEYPILTHGKSDDWENQMFFPVPLEYYYRINNPEFWYSRVRAYAGRAAYLGPKTIGSRWQSNMAKIDPIPGQDNVPLLIFDYSPEGVYRTTQENARRAQRRGILESLGMLDRGEIPDALAPPNVLAPADSFRIGQGLRETVTTNTLERNLEIQAYFDENRLDLAIDTMGKMTENVLYSHLIRTVGLGKEIVTPAEFRVFLKDCRRKDLMFRWVEMGSEPRPTQGIVIFVKQGWEINELSDEHLVESPDLLTPRRDYEPVSSQDVQLFDACAEHMMDQCSHFIDLGQKDLDFDLFLKWMNLSLASLHGNVDFKWTKYDLLRCIYHWEAHGERWTIGPLDLPEGNPPVRYPSVVRKLGTGWVDPPSPRVEVKGATLKMRKKRKRKVAEDELKSTGGRMMPIVCGKEPLKKKRKMA